MAPLKEQELPGRVVSVVYMPRVEVDGPYEDGDVG